MPGYHHESGCDPKPETNGSFPGPIRGSASKHRISGSGSNRLHKCISQIKYSLKNINNFSCSLSNILLPKLLHSSSSHPTASMITSSSSFFTGAKYIPPDPIFEVTKRYLADTDPKKVNLGQGAYRDENGAPWILPSVRAATELIAGCGHEYLPIEGLNTFRDEAAKLVFGGTNAWKEERVRIE